MSIYIWVWKKPMQWPCPDGFHVPSESERDSYQSYVGGGAQFNNSMSLIKMSAHGVINYSTGTLSLYKWYLWSSTVSTISGNGYAYSFGSDDDASPQVSNQFKWMWLPIRPFKNEYVSPTWDWWQLLSYWIWSAYRESYRNQSLWLISVPNAWITMADKNLWATNVGDAWYYYQWWNNYWFTPWTFTTSSTAVSAAWYWPWNYYSSSTFITQGKRDTSGNADLWWGVSAGGVPPEISNVYLWTTPVKEVYVWTDKIRPIIREASVEYLLVWWWGAWWRARYRAWWWGWAWWLVYCEAEILSIGANCCVVIWSWWVWWAACYNGAYKWWDSCFGTIVAHWGWGWWWMCACNRWCPWTTWGSGWWWAGCNTTCAAGCTGQWNRGWAWCATRWWGWGWACTAWCNAACWGNYYGWDWWCWCIFDISWVSTVYAWWWGWWGYTGRSEAQWWWCGWCYRTAWCPATTYGSWWGWAWCTASNSCCLAWWNWCQWVFIARYPANCWYNISWWCKYECNWYCIHCFTQDWTLTVN